MILDNLDFTRVVGIDPYPGLPHIRSIMESECSNFLKIGRFCLLEDLESIPKEEKFDFIHIDGEHSEDAIRKDITVSFSKLNDGGLLIIDDFMSRMFPGLTAQIILLAHQLCLKPVLITEYKIYLVREADQSSYRDDILKISEAFETGTSGLYRNGVYGETYAQNGEILGVNAYVQPTLPNWKIRKLLSQKTTVRSFLKSARYFLVPPIVDIIMSILLKSLRAF